MGYKITEEIIERVREYNDIVEVIESYIQLKKSGSNYKALCPFHSEKTPSFIVSPAKQIYHCFGCGVGGDVINFVMRYEKISFVEAVVLLAERANIKLEFEDETSRRRKDEREKLYEIMEWAAEFYKKHLNTQARNYLKNRGITDEVIEQFGLGYAPKDWDGLIKAARERKYSLNELEKCGLVVRKTNNFYDRFRDKIIFPIIDYMGRVIAFGSRVLDNSEPKYINSPETILFNKSRVLYGIHSAKSMISKENQVVVVEGYMDVIKMHSSGFKNVVGVLGTALTPEHIKILNRYTRNIFLLFDNDSAGEEATNRAFYNIFTQQSPSHAYAIRITDAKDPDELIDNFGAEKMYEFLRNPVEYVEFKVEYLTKRYDVSNVEGRGEAARVFLEELREFKIQEITKEEYIKKFAAALGISEFALFEDYYLLKKRKKITRGVENNVKSDYIKKSDKIGIEILKIVLNCEDINTLDRIFLEIHEEIFKDEAIKRVFLRLKEIYENDGVLGIKNNKEKFYFEYPDIFIQIEDRKIPPEEIDSSLKLVRQRQLKEELEQLKKKIITAEKAGDIEKLDELLREYQEVSRLLKVEGGI